MSKRRERANTRKRAKLEAEIVGELRSKKGKLKIQSNSDSSRLSCSLSLSNLPAQRDKFKSKSENFREWEREKERICWENSQMSSSSWFCSRAGQSNRGRIKFRLHLQFLYCKLLPLARKIEREREREKSGPLHCNNPHNSSSERERERETNSNMACHKPIS